ncbi:MAG: FAD-dependent oxidoreductase, partial [Candidatus Limnocylindrales bacterium]
MAPSSERLDLAIVGAGVAGTFIADAIQQARPDWSIAILERTDRIGGRLRSVTVPGLGHRIELGGMRFLTSQPHVQALVESLELRSHPFDRSDGSQRSYLRGRFGDGPADPRAGDAYDLLDHERGRSADDLSAWAFQQVLAGAESLPAEAYVAARAAATYLDRRLVDWPVGEALATIL